MLASTAQVVQAIHVGLLACGTACAAGWLISLARRGRRRLLWGGASLPPNGPSLASAGIAVLMYVVLNGLLGPLLSGGVSLTGATPGSDAWHRALNVDAAAKLVTAGVMVALLVVASPRRSELWRFRGTAAAVFACVAVLPVVELQLELGRRVWTAVRGDAPLPVHDVLEALGHSTWGEWGQVQLALGATAVAPLVEELFFRGLLLSGLCQVWRRPGAALLVSALAFGLVHAQPQDILPLVTLGLVLGYLRLRTGSLWPCLLAHMLFNARTVAFALLVPEMVQ